MPSDTDGQRTVLVVLGVVTVVGLLYSVLVVQHLLLGVLVTVALGRLSGGALRDTAGPDTRTHRGRGRGTRRRRAGDEATEAPTTGEFDGSTGETG